MAKIRNYTYGSPKFEREINKAVSDSDGKLYMHKIFIQAEDAEHISCEFGMTLYLTTATPLFSGTSTIDDIVDTLNPFFDYGYSPAYISEGVEYHFVLTTEGTKAIEGDILELVSGNYSTVTVTTITYAYDEVIEV